MENKNGSDFVAVEFENDIFQIYNTNTGMRAEVPLTKLCGNGYKYFSDFRNFFLEAVQAENQHTSIAFSYDATKNIDLILEFNRVDQ